MSFTLTDKRGGSFASSFPLSDDSLGDGGGVFCPTDVRMPAPASSISPCIAVLWITSGFDLNTWNAVYTLTFPISVLCLLLIHEMNGNAEKNAPGRRLRRMPIFRENILFCEQCRWVRRQYIDFILDRGQGIPCLPLPSFWSPLPHLSSAAPSLTPEPKKGKSTKTEHQGNIMLSPKQTRRPQALTFVALRWRNSWEYRCLGFEHILLSFFATWSNCTRRANIEFPVRFRYPISRWRAALVRKENIQLDALSMQVRCDDDIFRSKKQFQVNGHSTSLPCFELKK